ncbi:MAG TPA: hypothetical protein VMW92_02315 [Candidatus Heimdallarchaeota archaeon]|nr:hypothetical protein [Candidatus Heimdallarchaeota archaeon]
MSDIVRFSLPRIAAKGTRRRWASRTLYEHERNKNVWHFKIEALEAEYG